MAEKQQILEYSIQVIDCLKDGHPIQRIEFNLQTAAEAIDQLHESYPEHDVVMYGISKVEIKRFHGVKPEPKCPRGCTGRSDGRPIVVRTEKGLVQCKTCGFLG